MIFVGFRQIFTSLLLCGLMAGSGLSTIMVRCHATGDHTAVEFAHASHDGAADHGHAPHDDPENQPGCDDAPLGVLATTTGSTIPRVSPPATAWSPPTDHRIPATTPGAGWTVTRERDRPDPARPMVVLRL